MEFAFLSNSTVGKTKQDTKMSAKYKVPLSLFIFKLFRIIMIPRFFDFINSLFENFREVKTKQTKR